MKMFKGFGALIAAMAMLTVGATPAMAADPQLVLAPITTTTAAEQSKILATKAVNLYRISVTSGASAGFLMVFAQATVPADGAVPNTIRICRPVPAGSFITLTMTEASARLSPGAVAVFSTTGCYTITKSSTAFFEAYVR